MLKQCQSWVRTLAEGIKKMQSKGMATAPLTPLLHRLVKNIETLRTEIGKIEKKLGTAAEDKKKAESTTESQIDPPRDASPSSETDSPGLEGNSETGHSGSEPADPETKNKSDVTPNEPAANTDTKTGSRDEESESASQIEQQVPDDKTPQDVPAGSKDDEGTKVEPDVSESDTSTNDEGLNPLSETGAAVANGNMTSEQQPHEQ